VQVVLVGHVAERKQLELDAVTHGLACLHSGLVSEAAVVAMYSMPESR
jgi:hypothetical protein